MGILAGPPPKATPLRNQALLKAGLWKPLVSLNKAGYEPLINPVYMYHSNGFL